MPREQADVSYLWDMLTAARAVADFTSGRTFEEYSEDLMLRSAVEGQVEIIGEASRRVSEAFRQQHPEIPWSKIKGQSHVLAHDYEEIRHDRLCRWPLFTETFYYRDEPVCAAPCGTAQNRVGLGRITVPRHSEVFLLGGGVADCKFFPRRDAFKR